MYIGNDDCQEWLDFVLECSLTYGEDVLEEIYCAAFGKPEKYPNIVFSEIRTSPCVPGGTFTGTYKFDNMVFDFEYESTNNRGCVVHTWDFSY